MRDLNRLKVKYTFQLDSQQVLMIFVGLLCLCAVVFSLGVMFGKRLGGLTEPQAPTVAEAEELEAENGMDRLPKPPTEDSAPAVKPATEEAKPEKAEQAPVKPEAVAKDEAPKEQAKPKPKPEPKPKPKPEPTPEPRPEPAQEQPAATNAPSTQYAVQISSFKEEAQAKNFVKSFQSFDNRKPYIVPSEVPGKGTWYRVKIGRFDTREQAMAYQSIFEARTSRQTMLSTVD